MGQGKERRIAENHEIQPGVFELLIHAYIECHERDLQKSVGKNLKIYGHVMSLCYTLTP